MGLLSNLTSIMDPVLLFTAWLMVPDIAALCAISTNFGTKEWRRSLQNLRQTIHALPVRWSFSSPNLWGMREHIAARALGQYVRAGFQRQWLDRVFYAALRLSPSTPYGMTDFEPWRRYLWGNVKNLRLLYTHRRFLQPSRQCHICCRCRRHPGSTVWWAKDNSEGEEAAPYMTLVCSHCYKHNGFDMVRFFGPDDMVLATTQTFDVHLTWQRWHLW